MATIFDLLNTLNNNNNLYEASCRRQCPSKSTTSNNVNKKVINIVPDMDVTMHDDKLVLEVELPGVSKDNIDIDIKDSILTIQGEKKKKTTQSSSSSSLVNNTTTTTTAAKDEPSIEEFEEGLDEKSKIKKSTSSDSLSSSSSSSSKDKETSKDKEVPKVKETTNTPTDKKYISERSFGHFKRFLDLTKVIYQLDLNSISTKFEDGLLTIEINKKSDYSNSIKISIN